MLFMEHLLLTNGRRKQSSGGLEREGRTKRGSENYSLS